MGGKARRGFPIPVLSPPSGTSLNTSEAHQIGPDQVVHSLHLVRPNLARYLAFTRGGSDDGGERSREGNKNLTSLVLDLWTRFVRATWPLAEKPC
jgi:hypothetical protein